MKPETQYEHDVEPVALGKMMSQRWRDDPKMLGIVLARYKVVAKMLSGHSLKYVAEIGCGDGFGARLVEEEAEVSVDRYDLDPRWGWMTADIAEHPVFLPSRGADASWNGGPYDAVYALDVLEHIPPERTIAAVKHLALSVGSGDIVIVGTPSLESQRFASPKSKEGHVNCMTGADLRQVMQMRFGTVFMFGMQDETLHTGYLPMSHYLFALCVK